MIENLGKPPGTYVNTPNPLLIIELLPKNKMENNTYLGVNYYLFGVRVSLKI